MSVRSGMEIKMTSKQRAYLKGLAMTIDPIFQIGKSSVTPEFTEGIAEALEARELIKISVLKNCDDEINMLAHMVADRTHSEVVQVIGRKIVLYRQSKENKKIELPR
jgi:RNA-binding protein